MAVSMPSLVVPAASPVMLSSLGREVGAGSSIHLRMAAMARRIPWGGGVLWS